jgi:multimeric flavodoxin WrbA
MTAPDREHLRRPRILLLNASLGGAAGNTAAALDHLTTLLAPHTHVSRHTLAEAPGFTACATALANADGLIIGTGTHWDSWSSHLQRFLEEATPAEGTALWLGKPVACVVSEHSVGGKGVLSRLQGVLVTLGCTLPPMSGLVLSLAAQTAARHETETAQDFWCADDLAVLSHNLCEALGGSRAWKTWPVDRTGFDRRWIHV